MQRCDTLIFPNKDETKAVSAELCGFTSRLLDCSWAALQDLYSKCFDASNAACPHHLLTLPELLNCRAPSVVEHQCLNRHSVCAFVILLDLENTTQRHFIPSWSCNFRKLKLVNFLPILPWKSVLFVSWLGLTISENVFEGTESSMYFYTVKFK